MSQQEARMAVAQAREQQRQRALLGVAWLLTLGLAGACFAYWHLRRNRVLLAGAHRELKAAVAEKEVLVQEIHHRVKNNLQLISSLLAWQSSRSSDPAVVDELTSSRARIQSMALVHDFLYRADNLAHVRLDTYLAELLNSLHTSLNSAQQPIELSAELDAVVMDAREASAFGLLVNELVTNAYKHAFTPRPAAGCTSR
ncbi:sensor histidine kinase [Hymenobacter cellulosilyticus]|uniref:histidine kinase n=1 Tax=Hymenobacter cellulosilyticus TaxID=2932248 RepID=A0A8T9QC61_9BACT|nr:sensor histidine kinase [Hymenobacter cellulosilyticus]UOQ75184.1 sensor histidine kinase [Hymenobacter cellulosilyticus]